jgi:hypothetical protein
MKKSSLSLICLAGLFLVTLGCKKLPGLSTDEPVAVDPNSGLHTGTYNLNVVYFIPSDLDTVARYQQRLNGVMLHTQRFITKWMAQWGYSNKTIGLPLDANGKLKMSVIRGSQPKESYPYEGGAGAMMTEINAYFAANPGAKTSDHILVITPTYSYGSNGDPSGGPFYGIGRWCFALDYTGLDTLNLGKPDDKFSTKWIGGLAHELGHGINLPHNGGAQSQNLLYGTSLMGTGNGTYGKAPTYLTPADVAILANGQLFSNASRTDWYSTPNCKIKKIYARYENNSIIVSGKYSSDKVVKDIAFYHRNTATDNGGYASVTFAAKPIGTDSFYVSMPLSDFRDKANTNYEFTIRLVHENGSITGVPLNYSFVNGTPVLTFGDKRVVNKTNWSLTSFSTQETAEEDGAAINVIDDAINTYWHSKWSSGSQSYPHTLVINMGAQLDVNRFTLRQRDSRRVKILEILTSNDNNTWTSLGDFTLLNTTDSQDILLAQVKNFRYFKLNMKSSYDGEPFAALSEVGTYKD